MKRILTTLLFTLTATLLLADADGNWTATTDGNWSDTANWKDGVIPHGKNRLAKFDAGNVSVTYDSPFDPVGRLQFNHGDVKLYGTSLPLDADKPEINAQAGNTYLYLPLIIDNPLYITGTATIRHLQRNELSMDRLYINSPRLTTDATDIVPLDGESNIIRHPLSIYPIKNLFLKDNGRYNLVGSVTLPTEQHFENINVNRTRTQLEIYNTSDTAPTKVTTDRLRGGGILDLPGNGTFEAGSLASFSGTLRINGRQAKVTDNTTSGPQPAGFPAVHLDASDLTSMTIASENGVDYITEWRCQMGDNFAKHDGALYEGARALPWIDYNALNGKPIVNFGNMISTNHASRALGAYLVYNQRMTGVKVAFAVLRSQTFVFTDTSLGHFHGTLTGSAPNWGWTPHILNNRDETHQAFRDNEATVILNGSKIPNYFNQRLSGTQYDVVAMILHEGVATIDTIAYDRAWRYGGQQLAEEIIYDRMLTDSEIASTVAYLRQKWQDVTPDSTLAGGVALQGIENTSATVPTTIEIAAGNTVALKQLMGQGTTEISGGGTLQLERDQIRPLKPLTIKGSTLELVNRGAPVDTSMESLDVPDLFFHLDASDLSSMTLSNGKVLEWRDSSNSENERLAYALDTGDNPAPTLAPGKLNGKPVVDFGAWQSGSLMLWNHTNTTIRTLFMVFDHIAAESFWLSDTWDGATANFHRNGQGAIFHTGWVAGGLVQGQVHLNGSRVDPYNTYIPQEEPFLISFICSTGTAAKATAMAADRYPSINGIKYRTGGQRIAEVLIYDRHLTQAERARIEGYLTRKWLPKTPAGFLADTTRRTINDVVFDGATPATIRVNSGETVAVGSLSGHSDLIKSGEGTLITDQLSGLSGTLSIAAGTLKFASRNLPSPYSLPAGIVFHLDASNPASLELDADGTSILKIWDTANGGNFATPSDPAKLPQLMADELNGKPVISFGAANSGCSAIWDQRSDKIRSVFWIIGSQEGGGMPLGTKTNDDGSHFKRQPITGSYNPIWSNDSTARYGVTRVNGAIVDGLTTGFNGGYQLMSLMTDRNSIASAFATHKNVELSGGQRLAEVIVFDRLLHDQERRDVEAYLSQKWFGTLGSGYAGGTVKINNLTLDGGSIDLPTDRDVEIDSYRSSSDLIKNTTTTLAIRDLSQQSGSVVVSNGTLRLAGKSAYTPPPIDGMLMHMDASVAESFETIVEDGTTYITRWNSLVGDGYAATDDIGKLPWLLHDELNGLPIVDFGPYIIRNEGAGITTSDGAYLKWNTLHGNIRSGFIVLGSQNGGNFIITSDHDINIADFHRGYGSGDGDPAGTIVATSREEPPETIYSNGAWWSLDGNRINPGITGLSGGYQSIGFVTDPNVDTRDYVYGSTFAKDRIYRAGGQRLGEFIIYNRQLTAEERTAVDVYLQHKWFGTLPNGYFSNGLVADLKVYNSGIVDSNGELREITNLSGDGTVINGTLQVNNTLTIGSEQGGVGTLTLDNLKLATGATVNIDIADSTADKAILTGTLTIGSSGTIALTHSADKASALIGTYQIFTADSFAGTENLADWTITGLPAGAGARLKLNNNTIELAIYSQGTMLLVR